MTQGGEPGPLRAVVADDAALFRAGIVRILQSGGIEVVGEADDRDGLLALARSTSPDVTITDIRMPPTGTVEGLDAAATIRVEQPDVAVVLLSQHVEVRHALRLLSAGTGGIGYLLKDRVVDASEFLATVRHVAAGGSAIDPEVVEGLLGIKRVEDDLGRLTARERDVLALMAEGRSNRGIGDRLAMAPKTVETHISSIMSKLGLEVGQDDHRRVLAVLAFLRAAR